MRIGIGKATSHLISWRYGVLLLALLAPLGCRSLRTGRQAQALSKARFSSMQGAEKLQQEKFQDAEMLFLAALSHSPADEQAHRGMAEILWQQGQYDKAIAEMSVAAEVSGRNPDFLVRLGEMHLAQGMVDQAIENASKALQAQRDHAGAWALQGKALKQKAELDSALASYHRALQLKEHYPEVQLAIAEIYHAVGRPQRALGTVEALTNSRTLDEVPAAAWLLKGLALADLGQQHEAKDCLREASLCADERDLELLLKVAEAHASYGDLAEARVCLGRAQRHDPDNPKIAELKSRLDQSFRSISSNSALVGFGQPVPEASP